MRMKPSGCMAEQRGRGSRATRPGCMAEQRRRGSRVAKLAPPAIIGGDLRVRHESAQMGQLPRALSGLKILHISDLHTNDDKYMDIWRHIAELDFHLAVITGDIILNNPRQLEPYLPKIEALAKRVPVFYVEGNHDIYDYDDIKKMLEGCGVTALANQELDCVLKDFGHIKIVGIRDLYYLKMTKFAGIDRLFSKGRGEFRLVLSHQPQIFDRIKEYGPILLLAGHTHGGQIRLPFCPTLYAPGQGILPKYGDGWYRYESSRMYISRGIGTTLFPLRLFNPPEIAVVTLIRAE